MWYFAWMLGVGFAILFAILNAMWGENEEAREAAFAPQGQSDRPGADSPAGH